MAIVLMTGTVSLAILWIPSLSSWVHIDAANFGEDSQYFGLDEPTEEADQVPTWTPDVEYRQSNGEIPKHLGYFFHTSP